MKKVYLKKIAKKCYLYRNSIIIMNFIAIACVCYGNL